MEDYKIISKAAKMCGHLECDGTVKVLTYMMNEHGIKHQVYIGTVTNFSIEAAIPLHYWIELPNGMTVDYKCRMWLGKDAPNGIFKQSDNPDYVYEGEPIDLKVSKIIYQILTNDF